MDTRQMFEQLETRSLFSATWNWDPQTHVFTVVGFPADAELHVQRQEIVWQKYDHGSFSDERRNVTSGGNALEISVNGQLLSSMVGTEVSRVELRTSESADPSQVVDVNMPGMQSPWGDLSGVTTATWTPHYDHSQDEASTGTTQMEQAPVTSVFNHTTQIESSDDSLFSGSTESEI